MAANQPPTKLRCSRCGVERGPQVMWRVKDGRDQQVRIVCQDCWERRGRPGRPRKEKSQK